MGEVKGNLIKEERQEALARFCSSDFKKIAMVILGEPDASFKKKTQDVLQEKKQQESDVVFQDKLKQEKTKRAMERRVKEMELQRRKFDKEKVKTEKAFTKTARKS